MVENQYILLFYKNKRKKNALVLEEVLWEFYQESQNGEGTPHNFATRFNNAVKVYDVGKGDIYISHTHEELDISKAQCVF